MNRNLKKIREFSFFRLISNRRRLLFGIGAFSFFNIFAQGLKARGIARSFRVHNHGDYTRIVFDLTQVNPVEIFQLSNPYRVVIDLPEISWEIPTDKKFFSTGVIEDLRYGLFKLGQSRVVLDLVKPANISRSFYLPPTNSQNWRLVIDLSQVPESNFLSRLGRQNSLKIDPLNDNEQFDPKIDDSLLQETNFNNKIIPTPKKKPAVKPSDRKVVVAIDAGHGGVDPGAIGVSGVREKDITLAAAKELKKALSATGRYNIVMTRSRDISLGLRQRINIARRAAANVFISLHADSINKSNVRGLSVYTLSEKASDKEAANLAEKENKADLIIGMDLTDETNDVRNILIDLAQRESMNLAVQIARSLISSLSRQVTLLRNTHRFAGFAVLKSPDIPSILLEMGYLSNREDERLLKRSSYRRKLIKSIVKSFESYFYDIS